MTLAEILRDSAYKITQFNLVQIQDFEKRIVVRLNRKGAPIPYIVCAIRKKEIKFTPEEVVRQLFIGVLMNEYGYPAGVIHH